MTTISSIFEKKHTTIIAYYWGYAQSHLPMYTHAFCTNNGVYTLFEIPFGDFFPWVVNDLRWTLLKRETRCREMLQKIAGHHG